MDELPLAPVRRIIKGISGLRVSDGAGMALKAVLEEEGEEISNLALKFAASAGRKTVVAEDISKAIEVLE